MDRVAGLDVHKDSIFCCVKRGRYQSAVKVFSTTTQGLKELYHFLHGEPVVKVAMESTGIYWMPVWRALEQDFTLLLVNPYFIKQMPGRKSDVQDAVWIATLLDKKLLKSSLVPEKEIRILREYLRRYVHLQGQMTRVIQQLERRLSQCNIKICSLTSKINNNSVIKVVRSIIAGQSSSQELTSLVHKRTVNRHGQELIEQSLDGIIEQHDRFFLGQIMQEYDLINAQCEELLAQAEQLADQNYKAHIERLCTIPGISKLAAVIVFCEIGGDISKFASAENLVGWAGMRPKNDESAGKIKTTRIGKGNRYLRRILVQSAWAASRTKGCYLKSKFEKLSLRKSRKKALIAIARKELVLVWNILSKQEDYKEPKITLSPQQAQRKKSYYQAKLNQIEQQLEKVG